uniref:Secreted protein n=1 Tax=Setaria viridis TaxID=4556 RepID=A0A4U6UY38_SETVI|nr:hypothetical protein SEVIR_4G129002v2 [Setaria viridis]
MSALMICSLPQIVAAPTATTLFAGGRRNELQCSQIQGPRVNTISVTGKVSARTTSCVDLNTRHVRTATGSHIINGSHRSPARVQSPFPLDTRPHRSLERRRAIAALVPT